MRRAASLALAALLAFSPLPLLAQQAAPQAQGEANREGSRRPVERASERRLPPDSVTEHSLELPGRTLRFTARAGSIVLPGPDNVQAEIGYVAYTLKGEDPRPRPVTFAVNGGPGAASAYLHIGVLGPWRLPLDGATISPSAPPALVANAETWLDFTDLVFLDPVGTGFSRANGSNDDIAGRYFTIDGDIASLADVIARWLRANDRVASPKFFIGESYGGFRGPLLARKLQSDHGYGLSGLILLSPVLDFAWISQPRHNPWVHVARLPSYVAARREMKAPLTREALQDAEAYASTEFVLDLTRGLQDKAAMDRLAGRVAELTGLDRDLVARLGARIPIGTFQREFRRAERRIVSAYDTGVSANDPDPTSDRPSFPDPVLSGTRAVLTSAMVDLYGRTLNWKPEGQYQLLNGGVNGAWRWGRSRSSPESLSELREAVAADGALRVLVVHGFTDLVTPYFASHLLLAQLPDYGPERRVELKVYPGGHMFYSRDPSREAFRADALRMIRAALDARTGEGR